MITKRATHSPRLFVSYTITLSTLLVCCPTLPETNGGPTLNLDLVLDAVEVGTPDQLKQLLDVVQGLKLFDLGKETSSGWTLLTAAIVQGNRTEEERLKIVDILLEYAPLRRTINYPAGIRNSTPLEYSLDEGFTTIAKFLIASGADVNQPEEQPPLITAAACNNTPVVAALLKEEADPNATDDEDNRTALSYAAEYGNRNMIRLLIYYGAQVNPIDNKNLTPLDYAMKNNYIRTAQLLRQAGATPSRKRRKLAHN